MRNNLPQSGSQEEDGPQGARSVVVVILDEITVGTDDDGDNILKYVIRPAGAANIEVKAKGCSVKPPWRLTYCQKLSPKPAKSRRSEPYPAECQDNPPGSMARQFPRADIN